MNKLCLTLLALVFVTAGAAAVGPSTYADVKAQNGERLSPSDLRSLLSDANIRNRTLAGSTHSWVTKANGTLVATTDSRGQGSGRNAYGTTTGTWEVDDKGLLCVRINWNLGAEEWCRYVFGLGGKYYAVSRLKEDAVAHELDIRR